MRPCRRPRYPQARRHAGFTLVEVLVSIVILSFGLLGMVGLQAASLQANRDARLQSTAIVLARELAEMMRGNKDAALAATGNPYLGSFTQPLTPAAASYCLNVGSSCTTTTDVANAEMTDWLARVNAELPTAQVSICNDATPFDAGTNMPQWACTGAATDPIVVKIGWTRSTYKSGEAALQLATAAPLVVLSITPGTTTP